MRKIQLLAIGLVLLLAGFVYAAGNAQDSKKSCAIAQASCCANCCESKDSCCQAHKTMNHQAAAQSTAQDKKDCCAGHECCKGETACCKSNKADTNKAHSCDMSKEGAKCCEGSCCSQHKTKTS